MRNFDRYIKSLAGGGQVKIPESVKSRIEDTLSGLPEIKTERKTFRVRGLYRAAAIFACLVFTVFFLLPNISVQYAHALEQMPIIGDIVRVITIRNYFYSDDKHEMKIDVPEIEDTNGGEIEDINDEVKKLTDTLVERFYKDLNFIGENGHSSIYVDYDTITDTGAWFTLKIRVHEAAGSSNTYYKYYHFCKLTGKTVKLGDIVKDEAFYHTVEEDIKKQMSTAMLEDGNLKYWVNDSTFGDDIVSINGEHNFYWNKDGDIVIPFDKYEVAPGYMGTPEFTVKKDLIKDFLKDEIRNIALG